MKPVLALILLYIAEILLPPSRRNSYQNLEAVITAGAFCIINTVAFVVVTATALISPDELGWIMVALQAAAIIICKLIVNNRNKHSKSYIPSAYSKGLSGDIVRIFYKQNDIGPGFVLKSSVDNLGIACFVAAAALYLFFIFQSYYYTDPLLPETALSLVSLALEAGLFLSGKSVLSSRIAEYQRKKGCRNSRELAAAKHSCSDDYEYLFRDNHISNHAHIIRATKQHYLPDSPVPTITFYDFKTKKNYSYNTTHTNVQLENFITENNLKVNELFCAAYNLLDENQNVLLKAPSYADFEPYLAAIIKQKIAKTEKIVFIVNSVDNQRILREMLSRSFTEYFGFEAVPVIRTIGEWCNEKQISEQEKKNSVGNLNPFSNIPSDPDEIYVPEKEPDVVIASPDDICDPLYTPLIRKAVAKIGLLVYYDFNDCVQEEPLFAKTVHSILDSEDAVSTLYMTDGFFDLEQALDNFFSTRTIYQITVPRSAPETSYDIVWKSENSQRIQSREIADASRNFGTHIALAYYALGFISNDAMVVADEFDAYAENIHNYTNESVLGRIDHHIGWKDVIGGESVYCTVSDTYNNIAHTYLSMRGIGRKSEFINIISRPYLLRKYLAYNLKYFSSEPGVLTTFSSGIIKTPRAVASQAVALAYILGCTPEKLTEYANTLKLDATFEPGEILKMITVIAYEGEIDVIITQKDGRYHLDKDSYITIMSKNEFISKMIFTVNNETIRRPYRDYKYLVPQQKLVLNGIKYTVLSVNGNQVELTDSNNRDPVCATRTVRTCLASVSSFEDYGKNYHHGNDSYITFSHLVCNVDVNVVGRITFTDSYSLLGKNAHYTFSEICNVAEQKYTNANIFRIKIGSPMINSANKDTLAHMFALLFNEMLPTFFPKHSDKIMVACSGWSIPLHLSFDDITPRHIVTPLDINDPDPAGENEICMYIMEDSAIETGIVNVFWQDEEFKYMLKILEDYLYHIEFVDRDEAIVMFGKEYLPVLHKLRKLLLFVINENEQDEDLVLASGNRVYVNSIRTSKRKFNKLDLTDKYSMSCDFCGAKITSSPAQKNAYHYYQYSGIVSCPDCYAKAICSEKHGIDAVTAFELGIDEWFQDKYRETAREIPFYNYFEDVEYLCKNTPFANRFIITDDAFDAPVAGISRSGRAYPGYATANNIEHIRCTPLDDAVDHYDIQRAAYRLEDNSDRAIFIRDGYPQDEYLVTLCHEMVHQWQFTSLDDYKMHQGKPHDTVDEFGNPVSLDGFRYEGHAVWTEIKYAKKTHKRKVARKRIKDLKYRNDEYGVGYRWMCDLMKFGHRDPYAPSYIHTREFKRKLRYYQLRKNAFGVMRLYYGRDVLASTDPAEETQTTDEQNSEE